MTWLWGFVPKTFWLCGRPYLSGHRSVSHGLVNSSVMLLRKSPLYLVSCHREQPWRRRVTSIRQEYISRIGYHLAPNGLVLREWYFRLLRLAQFRLWAFR